MTYQLKIGNIDYTQFLVLPIKTGAFFDERLDEATITLKRVPINKFTPLTKVELKVDNETLTYLIAEDESLEVPVGRETYNHTLYLTEETKDLEGYICDALTFTNELGTNFGD